MDGPDITEQWEGRLADAAPTRGDDTPVLAGQTGRQATPAEIMALIERVNAEIAAEQTQGIGG